MKNFKILIITAFSCINTIVFSQTQSSEYSVGLRLELNQSNVGNSFYGNANTGFSIGSIFLFNYNRFTSIVTGIDYQRKGGNGFVPFYNFIDEPIGGYSQNLYLHYASIPLLLKLESPSYKKLNVYCGFGGFYALLLDAWVNPQAKELSHEVIRNFNRNDLGIITSLGASLKLSKLRKLSLEWRYTLCLTNVSDIYKTTNQSNGVSLGYYFGTKSE